MAGKWLVFLTANETPQKAINRAFLLLRDYEFSTVDSNIETSWTLLNTLPTSSPAPATYPLTDLESNDFTSKSLAEINNFVRTNSSALENLKVQSSIWVIVDQAGLQTNTCIICKQKFDEEEEKLTDDFDCVRIPLQEAWIMYANLDVGNMDFLDWVDEDAGVQADGLWKWRGPISEVNEEVKKKTEAALEEAKEKGWIE